MGHMVHHTIIVSSFDKELIEEAHKKAKDILGKLVSNIVPSGINGYRSFFVAPDGSKEGWEESNHGNECRDRFVEWLDGQRYDDDSNSLGWVEVQFHDEELDTKVVRDDGVHIRAHSPIR